MKTREAPPSGFVIMPDNIKHEQKITHSHSLTVFNIFMLYVHL